MFKSQGISVLASLLILHGLPPPVAPYTLTFHAEHQHLSEDSNSLFICQTRETGLVACEFKLNDTVLYVTNGTASVLHKGYAYYGTGNLSVGECGILIQPGYVGEKNVWYDVSCRTRTEKGGWHYAFTDYIVSDTAASNFPTVGNTTRYAMVGDTVKIPEVTVVASPAATAIRACVITLPNKQLVNLTEGQQADETKHYEYKGEGLEEGQCGITLTNVTLEMNGDVFVDVGSGVQEKVTLIVQAFPTVNLDVTSGLVLDEDDLLTATCTATNNRPRSIVSWYLGDELLRHDNNDDGPVEAAWRHVYDVRHNTQNLRRRVGLEDNNKMLLCVLCLTDEPRHNTTQCNASDNETIQVRPRNNTNRMHIQQEPDELSERTQAKLTCVLPGAANDTVYRFDTDNDTVPTNDTSDIVLTVSRADNGRNVTCRAFNTSDGVETEIQSVVRSLEVLYAPKLSNISRQEASAGYPFVLRAVADGNPTNITYTWTKDGEELSTADGPVLNIPHMRRVNSGNYTVRASNTQGDDSKNFSLQVNYTANRVVLFQEPDELACGQQVVLTCEMSSNDADVVLTWEEEQDTQLISSQPICHTDGNNVSTCRKNVTAKDGNNITTLTNNFTLTADMDQLLYWCVARNKAQNIVSRDVVVLKVLHAPIFQYPPHESQLGIAGHPFLLSVQATGNPNTINYTWIKDGDVLLDQEDRALNFTALRSEDAGNYTAVASNTVGNSTVSFTLAVHECRIETAAWSACYPLAIAALCVALVLLVVVIFLCCSKRSCFKADLDINRQERECSAFNNQVAYNDTLTRV